MEKPVIFIALANGQGIESTYLRQLKVEREAIEHAFFNLEDRCEVYVMPDAGIEDIFRVFKSDRFKGRIAVFHFAGHADGDSLMLEGINYENQEANGKYLARFLSAQASLKLLFFNACATQGHLRFFEGSDIPNFIFTYRSITDEAASDFARRFYEGIAAFKSVFQSFNLAESEMLVFEGMRRDRIDWGGIEEENEKDTQLWKLISNKDWSLADLAPQESLEVIIVYATEDEKHKKEFGKHLTALKRRRLLSSWDASELLPGANLTDEFKNKIKQAKVVFLIISANYLTSDFCFELEELVMEYHRTRKLRVVPILLSNVDYEGLPFSNFQALPHNGIPVLSDRWNSPDEAYVHIVEHLKRLL